MKNLKRASFVLLTLFVACVSVWASDAIANETIDLKGFIDPLKQANGFTLLSLCVVGVQFLNLTLGFVLGRLAGIYRLLIVNALTLICGVVVLRIQGFSWVESFLHSQTTAMAQVFFHQLIKQFFNKPKDTYLIETRRFKQ